jgi:hypothetical protein
MDHLLRSVRWNEDGSIAELDVEAPLFGRVVSVSFFADDRKPAAFAINEAMRHALADFLALDGSAMARVAELLFENCCSALEGTDYGVDALEGETLAQANHRDFAIHTPADALDKSHFRRVTIHGEVFANRYFSLLFETPWGDLQHVVAKNGRLFTVYQDGVWFGQFDEKVGA